MIDPELKTTLGEINNHLTVLEKKRNPGIWRSFFNGMFGALGYIAGLALVIVVLGWILNQLGLLPAFKQQLKDFQSFMNSAERLVSGTDKQADSTPSQSNQNGYMITLPNGQKAEVIPQQ